MAKHVISVCIFCFICATHSPCASHAEVMHRGDQGYNSKSPLRDPNKPTIFREEFKPREKYKAEESNEESILNTFNPPTSNKYTLNVHNIKRRDTNLLTNSKDKTHISSSTNSGKSMHSDIYLKKIFTMFGNGEHMTLEGFQKLLKRLDLMDKVAVIHDHLHDHHHHDHGQSGHNTEQNYLVADQKVDENKTCLDQDTLMTSIREKISTGTHHQIIDNATLSWACPALLYGMLAGKCAEEDGDLMPVETQSIDHLKWFYSVLAVVVISACGLLGLAVIPVMKKKFYQPLLQFLVALAVGTLAGDALLHLLPHAMGHADSHNHESSPIAVSHPHDHDDKMWKGFTAMLGLIFFFMMERLITLCAKWRKTMQLKEKMPSRLKIMMPEGNPPQNPVEKQCKHKYSSFPMCYDEITMLEGQNDDIVFRLAGGTDSIESHNNTATTTMDDLGSNSDIGSLKLPRANHKIEANQNMTECPNEANNLNCTEVNKMLGNETEKEDTGSLEYTVILREHETRHHGHSHAHGHVHSAPKSLSAVAWMVVMGDGLHNFTDGMAIGAAFASSIAGGFSTAVAVLCHELPHELGDFAVLLKAGMTLKQALLYNLLSSILCLLGNIFGLWVGATETASQWIFAVAAGMFLYIALVDMIPELSSGHKGEGTLFQCLLHLGGLMLGFTIMTLIALYEHDLKNIFHESI